MFYRTNIVLDDHQINEAKRLTGIKTTRGVVEEALRTLIRLKQQESVRSLRGKLQWEGDLDAMREERFGLREDEISG